MRRSARVEGVEPRPTAVGTAEKDDGVIENRPGLAEIAVTLRWAFMLGLMVVIFVADTITALEIAVAVFYVAVVLIADGFLRRRGVLVVAASCIVLTLASFFFTHAGAYEAGVINCALSLCAIAITTYLALTRSSVILAEHEARAQLVRLARVNTLGEMTASIAHEVNQPLTAVVTSANAGLRWLAAGPPNLGKARQALERIIGDANRASNIVAQVRNLSKRADPRADWQEAPVLVAGVVALSRGELDRNGVRVRVRPADGLPLVLADSVQVQQVLLNIVLNAIDAMAATPAERRELAIDLACEVPGFVRFSIRDHGTGVPPEAVAGIFDAFYTTKPQGMGIGLAVSRSIVEAHGGRIWVEPQPEGGAVFHFTLRARQTRG
ncbi:sensor histidine kinase [Paracoccus kondratievae]|uniref:histidine kinase n=1 Tax=Paracoccus kondratievae TaxID=135740 RepID=A0AAD3P1W4_9RHOB|nr:ATP-binding protein [Paracoccus kondratievae]GLK65903.1 two-component sensor histidine kinase [Paracoccus kondratievae]